MHPFSRTKSRTNLVTKDVETKETGQITGTKSKSSHFAMDVEALEKENKDEVNQPVKSSVVGISYTGMLMLLLLVIVNSIKNLSARYVMGRAEPQFILSAAVIGTELTKLTLSVLHILIVDRKSPADIFEFLRDDRENSMLLIVPACVYNAQQTLEYVAFRNLNVSVFVALVQTKIICTAIFATLILKKKLRKSQWISLLTLMIGVILCNNKSSVSEASSILKEGNWITGVAATLSIAMLSGFAAVYTEKVMKKNRRGKMHVPLAFMQIQLALVSVIVMGVVAICKDLPAIQSGGLWQNFDRYCTFTVINSGLCGLAVAGVLRYADSVLKGFAGAVSVIVTGISSAILFGTTLTTLYYLGILNVFISLVLYNDKNLDTLMC